MKLSVTFNDFDFVADNTFSLNFLSNNLLASSCENMGGDGLKNKIIGVRIESDTTFNDLASGMDLSEHFSAQDEMNLDGEYVLETIEFEALIDRINSSSFWIKQYYLTLNLIPMETEEHKLSIFFELDNGDVLSSESEVLYFN
jgi:hypothetical protein